MAKVKLSGYRCDRCGHEWLPRDKSQDPLVCPKCKSPYWNTPRTREYFVQEPDLISALGQPMTHNQRSIASASGRRVSFADSHWQCGCVGERREPGNGVFLKPCSAHRGFVARLKGPSS